MQKISTEAKEVLVGERKVTLMLWLEDILKSEDMSSSEEVSDFLSEHTEPSGSGSISPTSEKK